MKLVATLVLALLIAAGSCDDCVCKTLPSDTYASSNVLDCTNLSLLELPNACLKDTDSISELWLSYNRIQDIRSTSLAELTKLRTLHLDNNNLKFVDPTAFEFMRDLEVFKIDHNLKLQLDDAAFAGLTKLREISTIGTNLVALPNISVSSHLTRVDFRSSKLASLPLYGLLHPELVSETFYMNLIGNDMTDMAASSLEDLPDNTKLFLETEPEIKLWVTTEEEKQTLLARPWDVNINMAAAVKLCDVDGLPGDVTICDEAF